jgi:glycosyltransferase involved in cell wall biosynthesis
VIAVSEFGRGELHTMLELPLERIEVILHGIEPTFAPGAAEPLPLSLQGRRFLLFVGDPIREPRKNFDLLYEAYRQAWPALDGPLLAIAGPRAPELPGIVHLGNLGDDLTAGGNDTLRACYRGAIALTLASYHETFGMPLLEAMACGTPVLASNASSLPEIGGEAALYAPADDAREWAASLRRIVDDEKLRLRLRAAGPERAKLFSWDRSADQHVALFASVAR